MKDTKVYIRYSELQDMAEREFGSRTIDDLTEFVEYMYGTGMAASVVVMVGNGTGA